MNSSFINTIKLLIHKEDPLIIDKIDFKYNLVFDKIRTLFADDFN